MTDEPMAEAPNSEAPIAEAPTAEAPTAEAQPAAAAPVEAPKAEAPGVEAAAPRPEVSAGPTSGRAPSRAPGDVASGSAPDPRNQRQAPGQKGYGPGGPQIGSTDAPLTEIDIQVLTESLAELKALRESMEAQKK